MTEHPHAAAATDPRDSIHDVVCGMEVTPRTSIKVGYQGQTYHFCSEKCREQFEREPAKFQGAAGRGTVH